MEIRGRWGGEEERRDEEEGWSRRRENTRISDGKGRDEKREKVIDREERLRTN